ncbi:MAG: PAS-domain containing protein [Sedimentitalea sp.]
MIDANDPPQIQVEKQARIIDALVRRARRQIDVSPSAYRAFQSAIELQEKVAAQSLELESVRVERERTRRTLAEALSSMEEGFALFSDGQLNVCNDLFKGLLPDISHKVVPGLPLGHYIGLMGFSRHLVSTERNLPMLRRALRARQSAGPVVSMVAEMRGDRWYQMSVQRTSLENTVLLLTEITALVRRNRIEKEHLIDRQADYLQAVFQNMGSGVCAFSASGELLMQNQRFNDILGLPLAMLQPGAPMETLLNFSRDLSPDAAGLKVKTWQDELRRNGVLTRRVAHGEDRVLDVQANVLPDGGFLVELKDVTLETRSTALLEQRVTERTGALTRANLRLTQQYEEQARVEEELRVANEQAEAAVSSKTRFLAAASHDLLQPINAAKLLISTLQETTRDSRFQPMVAQLQRSFASAEYLLHSLLDISRLESADPEMVSPTHVGLAALMEGVVEDQALIAQQKGVQLDVVPSTIVVQSDPVYLLRSIQNLVVNAVQYTHSGGRVLLGCRRRNGRVTLEVWDTGVGIAQKDQARIFEEFIRASEGPLDTGVGLGLSVVDRACRLLGHRLSVRSQPGRGSVFSIEMDIIAGETAQAVPRAPLAEADSNPLDYIVVVIENDADVLSSTTQWLEHWGASVLAARSTREALDHVTDMGIAPDIVLADYQLDGTDTGVQAVIDIRAQTQTDVPAILITADRSPTLRALGGRNDITVMTKPVELTRLRPLIDWKIRRHVAMLDRLG